MWVVDTSVCWKWFATEPDWEAARQVLKEGDLHAPDILPLEMANILVRKVRRGEFDHNTAHSISTAYGRLPIKHQPIVELVPLAQEIALRHGRHPYDCIFIALALQLKCPMITADVKLARGLLGTPFAGIVLELGWRGDRPYNIPVEE